MAGIYFTSDSHIGHKNLVRGVSEWEDKTECRDFDTLEEHDEILIQNINNTVSQDSILYHTGDFSMGGYDNVWKFRKRLHVKRLHLIMGNHDISIRNNKIVQTDEGWVNLQALFTSVDELLEKKIGGERIVLCHYPFRAWHKAGRGSWMLHGHEHGRLEDFKIDGKLVKTMDIGIDTHPELRPYHFDEIKQIMDKRGFLKQGHHE